jgi:hypothetical protein
MQIPTSNGSEAPEAVVSQERPRCVKSQRNDDVLVFGFDR